jgi:hypothetical protein
MYLTSCEKCVLCVCRVVSPRRPFERRARRSLTTSEKRPDRSPLMRRPCGLLAEMSWHGKPRGDEVHFASHSGGAQAGGRQLGDVVEDRSDPARCLSSSTARLVGLMSQYATAPVAPLKARGKQPMPEKRSRVEISVIQWLTTSCTFNACESYATFRRGRRLSNHGGNPSATRRSAG